MMRRSSCQHEHGTLQMQSVRRHHVDSNFDKHCFARESSAT
eukprot:CAMPEP_0173115490 /NCGR_PEP_ID=MMETSP1102-20130122/48526_1 /TAXON_ID=49646 /ORGANISM="Geminigera sp., Strain Caron Lab Isolate" /LENGTH=40 /DNA_ID= /DNA_START= /DNA_END= /DNA_ORIENTATION=